MSLIILLIILNFVQCHDLLENAITLVLLIISSMILNFIYVMISYSECHNINVINNVINNFINDIKFYLCHDVPE